MLLETVNCINNNPFVSGGCKNTISRNFYDSNKRMQCVECEAKRKARETFTRLAKLSEFTQ